MIQMKAHILKVMFNIACLHSIVNRVFDFLVLFISVNQTFLGPPHDFVEVFSSYSRLYSSITSVTIVMYVANVT